MMLPARALFAVAKVTISVALLWFVLRNIDYSETLTNVHKAHAGFLALAFLLLAVQPVLGAMRWYAIMRCLGAAISFRQSIRLTYVSALLNQVLPGGIGGDATRMWFSFREGHLLSHALNGVALDRGVAFLVLIWIAWASAHGLDGFPELKIFARTLLFVAVAALAGLASIMVLDRLPDFLKKYRAVRGLAYLAVDARRLFLNPRSAILLLSLGLLGNLNLCTSLFVFMLAFNVPLDLWTLALCTTTIILASSLPISVGGWGTREAAAAAMMSVFAVTSSPAVVASILFGVAGVLISLPGALSLYRSMSRQKRQNSAPPSLEVEAKE
jgi:glycosyltransferase 2 family protein